MHVISTISTNISSCTTFVDNSSRSLVNGTIQRRAKAYCMSPFATIFSLLETSPSPLEVRFLDRLLSSASR